MLLSRIGPIALEGPLGGSADSNVLRGVHVERNMKMAVKLLPRGLVNRPMGGDTFAEDVKRLQKLVHPGIARYYGGAMDNGLPYLAIELVPGESLRALLDRRGRLPWETMVDVADAVCQALEYAHGAGMVHQRLTPSRILVTEDGGVKLIGFDCVLADRDEVLGLHSPMAVAHYLAPEVFRGKKSGCQAPCDLFSLGVILYECMTGALPWQASTPGELVQARRAGPAPRVSAKMLDCPVWFDVLVARMLEVKHEDRLQSADATHRAIVDAKGKVAEGMGAVKHAWSGRQGALATGVDSKELTRLRKKQVTPERDDSPWYERAWFLALCLVAVIAGGAWVMWPPTEDALIAKARPLMQSEDPVDWRRAEDQYIAKIRQRFPKTKYAEEIAAFEDKYAVHRATQRLRNMKLTGRMPETEIERRFAEADRYEQFGDRLTAWNKYDALVAAFPTSDDEDDQAYLNLARQRINRIKADVGSAEELAALVREKLDEADRLIKLHQLLPARKVLDGIVELYGENREVQPLVEEARQRLGTLRGNSAPPENQPDGEAAEAPVGDAAGAGQG